MDIKRINFMENAYKGKEFVKTVIDSYNAKMAL